MLEAPLIILSLLVGVGAVLYVHHRLTDRPGAEEPSVEAAAPEDDSACCGMHVTCEKDSLLASVSNEIEYYEDEDLDAFKDRLPEDYDDDEIEQFRDVLLTLRPEEIAGWGRSLQLRGIDMPTQVREELLMIISEQRNQKDHK